MLKPSQNSSRCAQQRFVLQWPEQQVHAFSACNLDFSHNLQTFTHNEAHQTQFVQDNICLGLASNFICLSAEKCSFFSFKTSPNKVKTSEVINFLDKSKVGYIPREEGFLMTSNFCRHNQYIYGMHVLAS